MSGAAALQIEDAELPALIRRVLAEHLDDPLRIRALLQLLEHQHLVLVRAVDAGLARGHALAGHDHGLHAHQELIVPIDAGRRRDHDAAGGAIDGDDRPRGKRRSGQKSAGQPGQKGLVSWHGNLTPFFCAICAFVAHCV